jgi:hypothetical protein
MRPPLFDYPSNLRLHALFPTGKCARTWPPALSEIVSAPVESSFEDLAHQVAALLAFYRNPAPPLLFSWSLLEIPPVPTTTCSSMATTNTSGWQQTVAAKRQLREESIQKFVDAHSHDTSSAALPPTDHVAGILEAIASRTVTSSQLCTAYIQR